MPIPRIHLATVREVRCAALLRESAAVSIRKDQASACAFSGFRSLGFSPALIDQSGDANIRRTERNTLVKKKRRLPFYWWILFHASVTPATQTNSGRRERKTAHWEKSIGDENGRLFFRRKKEMEFKAGEILALLEKVAALSERTLSYVSLKEIHADMEHADPSGNVPFNEEYLYKQIYQKVQKKKPDETIGLNSSKVDYIARFAKFSGFRHFTEYLKQPMPAFLDHCEGNWFSYVRCNSGQPYLLKSPVRILRIDTGLVMELQGKARMFRGKIKYEGQCMYCLLESGEDKNLHLVFKFGSSRDPQVLQGVFSGMSSDGDPIAGREVLVRENELRLRDMKNERLPIRDFLKSKDPGKRALGTYFREKENNTLKIQRSSTFSFDDLCKPEDC